MRSVAIIFVSKRNPKRADKQQLQNCQYLAKRDLRCYGRNVQHHMLYRRRESFIETESRREHRRVKGSRVQSTAVPSNGRHARRAFLRAVAVSVGITWNAQGYAGSKLS